MPLFIRHFDPEEYGLWITTLSITSYFGLLNFGIAQVVIGVVTREHSAGRLAGAAPTVATALGLYIALALAAWLLATAALLYLHETSSSTHPEKYLALWITVSLFLVALPTQLFLGVLRGCKRVVDEQMFNAATMGLRYLVTAAGLLAGLKLVGIALVHGLIGLIPGWLAFLRLRRAEPALELGLGAFERGLVGEVMRPSAWFFVLQVSGLLVWGIDVIVIAAFLGPASVPAYAVPMQLVVALQAVAAIATNASSPHMAGLVMTGRMAEARRVYLDLLTISSMVGAVSCVGLWLGGRGLLEAWAGPTVVPEPATMFAMGMLLAIQCALLPADGILVGAMRHRGYAAMAVVEGLVNLALSLWWVMSLGALGVILATVVARLATSGWYMHYRVAKLTSLPARDVALEIAAAFALPLGCGLAVAWLASRSGLASHPLSAAFLGAIAAAIAASLSRRAVLLRLLGAKRGEHSSERRA